MLVEIKKYNRVYKYEKDDTNSFHRILTDFEKKKNLSFYKNHFYLDKKWECKKSIKKISEKEIENKKQKESLRTRDVFSILEKWGLIPPKQKPAKILDIGCGAGMFIKEWEERKYGEGHGIELSNIAKDISPKAKIEFLDANAIRNTHIENDVCLVVALDVFEHLFDVSLVLQTIFSKIINGTKILIEIPIVHDNITIEGLKTYKYLYSSRHLHLYTEKGFKKEIESSRFKILQSETRKNGNKLLILIEK